MSKYTKYRVDPKLPFRISQAPTSVSTTLDDKALNKQLKTLTSKFATLQRKLYAQDTHSLLLIFQAMDAAGKDSTIRAVTKGVNPAGFQVSSFRQPSKLRNESLRAPLYSDE